MYFENQKFREFGHFSYTKPQVVAHQLTNQKMYIPNNEVRPQRIIALVAILTFCLIMRKTDHQKLRKKFTVTTIISLIFLTSFVTIPPVFIRLPVFWECRHHSTDTSSDACHTATSHCQRSNISNIPALLAE